MHRAAEHETERVATTAVADDEMLVEIRIPARPDGSSAYEKTYAGTPNQVASASRRPKLTGSPVSSSGAVQAT